MLAPACSGDSREPSSPPGQSTAIDPRRPADGGGFSEPSWQQTLPDMNQNGITEWTSGTAQQVTVGGVTYTAWQLLTPDPFVKTWQLEDGTIVVSNEPLASLVTPNAMSLMQAQTPATTSWAPPGGTAADVYADELIVWFKPEATQADIEGIIAAKSLHVIMSWFEPKDDFSSGNEVAWFEFQLSGSVFTDLTDMYGYFSGHALVAGVEGNGVGTMSPAWSGSGQPNDINIGTNPSGYAYACKVNSSDVHVSYGTSSSQPVSNQVVCVMDDGVDRMHPDFWTGSSGSMNYNKITAVGVNCQPKAYWKGTWQQGNSNKDFGQPDYTKLNPAKGSHGNRIAGLISAATNENEGTACLAPRCQVMPMRLWVDTNGGYNDGAISKALRCLRFEFPTFNAYGFKVRVVNMSFYSSNMSPWEFLINRDLKPGLNDRLYVACAGNGATNGNFYPAAFDKVLGVTGFAVNVQPAVGGGFTFLEYSESNSNYGPLTTYPVSGPYAVASIVSGVPPAFINYLPKAIANGTYSWDVNDSAGTSFSTPCVAALAFHLYDRVDGATNYVDVGNRIVTTREPGTQTFNGRTYAGMLRFKEALNGWGTDK